MIRISNIYHMLAYAFRSINAGEISLLGNEEFENLHELFAHIIITNVQKQIKRGLPRRYVMQSEELSNLRGKIDIQSSVRAMTMIRHRLVCVYDEFTEDTPGNRLIKCAIIYLLRQKDVSSERIHNLSFLYSSLSTIADVRYIRAPQQRAGGAEYVILINICQFLLDGMLMKTNGGYKMQEWLSDEAMSSLYERFLLEYFRRHHTRLNARSTRIEWDMEDVPTNMPEMRSDIFLTYGGKSLIIDAKFYKITMSLNYSKKTFHSHNLYQIYTYVKNEDRLSDGSVSGMLLYAKTDEDITPDSDSVIGGNPISVKTLDLSQSFTGIQSQLERIAARLA